MACLNKCASHHPSLSSVLCPLRTFTSCGLAKYTFTVSSRTLKTGIQYDPVLSITTWVTSSCFSQSRSRSSSVIIVPNRRVCFRASPCNGPVKTQTAKNSFPTSMPAHRSTAAQIMFALLGGLENSRRLPGIRSSSAQLLHSGVLHVHLASFVLGTNCAPLPITAAFSSPAMRLYSPHFHFRGWPKLVIPFRSVNFVFEGWFIRGIPKEQAPSFAMTVAHGFQAAGCARGAGIQNKALRWQKKCDSRVTGVSPNATFGERPAGCPVPSDEVP